MRRRRPYYLVSCFTLFGEKYGFSLIGRRAEAREIGMREVDRRRAVKAEIWLIGPKKAEPGMGAHRHRLAVFYAPPKNIKDPPVED